MVNITGFTIKNFKFKLLFGTVDTTFVRALGVWSETYVSVNNDTLTLNNFAVIYVEYCRRSCYLSKKQNESSYLTILSSCLVYYFRPGFFLLLYCHIRVFIKDFFLFCVQSYRSVEKYY